MTEWRSSSSSENLKERARLLATIRQFFEHRKVMEVETPLLSHAGNSDPAINQLSTRDGSLWLRTSPEYSMKRLLACGSGDIYELGRVFRAGENGRHHNHEFTMLEWYRVGWTYHQLMEEVEDLLRFCQPERSFTVSRVCYRDLVLAYAGFDPMMAEDTEIASLISAKGVDLENLGRNGMLDLVISHFVQPFLPSDGLTFVYDYPAEQAALSRVRPGEPPVAERFELFWGSHELANGYQELTDADEQKRRFEAENRLRKNTSPMDHHLLEAMASGLPECAGVALGLDRLLMASLNEESLERVLAFPADRA
jgi:lysyl-tRNA synthetase class 2